MAPKNNNIRYGNVSSTLKNKQNFSVLKKPITTSFFSAKDKSVDTFNESKIQTKVAPFEITSGITSDSPEIILLSNFIPVYDDFGKLNKVGEVFQAKQDSLLVSANSSISSIINSSIYSDLVTAAVNNRNKIETFCSEFGQNIDEILKKFSIIKRKLDCRKSIDEKDLKLLGISSQDQAEASKKNPSFDLSPSSIEDILFEKDAINISKWTPTKSWIQIVLELKEIFRNGMPLLLSDSEASSIPVDNLYKSPYEIVTPRSAFIKKIKFNVDKQMTVPLFFSLGQATTEGEVVMQKKIRHLFDTKSSFGIFNKSIFSDTENLDVAISRLSHLICKEYVFSTKMKSSVLVDYGYSFDLLDGNQKIWDYLFGQIGSDITDVTVNPLGAGKSLISLSQYIEDDGTEVLAFEDNYIKDNIGTKRPDAIMTPGTFYYIESSINTTIGAFDTARIDSYVSRLKSAADMLSMLKNDLCFKTDVTPYLSVTQKITKRSEPVNSFASNDVVSLAVEGSRGIYKKDVESAYQRFTVGLDGVRSSGKSTDFKDSLSNPILLLRTIEQKVLDGSNLLKRSPGPKVWTTKPPTNSKSPRQLNRLSSPDDSQTPNKLSAISNTRVDISKVGTLPNTRDILDVSPLLISASLEDPDLMSLLFMYVSCEVTSIRSESSVKNLSETLQNTSSTSRGLIALRIMERLLSLYEKNKSGTLDSSYQKESGVFEKVSAYEIYDALINENTSSREILNNVVKVIDEYIKYFEILESQASNLEKFFLNDITAPVVRNTSSRTGFSDAATSDTKSSYSGVQKTTYIASIFQLCFLMVHAANPERITSCETKLLTTDYIVSLVKNPILNVEAEVKSLKSVQGNENNFPLVYDSTIVKCENYLSNYDRILIKKINRVQGFVFSLYKELESFAIDLNGNSGVYSKFVTSVSSIINDPAIASLIMSEEQMILIRSKLYDVLNRSSLSYDSELKRIVPYFLNLRDNENVDHFLPIEDVHLNSWNFLLKDFLSTTGFREADGFNKKIISIGIPQRLHRFLQSDASKLKGSSRRNKLIKIHVFKIDNLKPDVVYKPLTYLFDLNRFSTRILKNYVDSKLSINGNPNLDLSKIPILKAVSNSNSSAFNSFSVINDQTKSFEDYQFLSENEKQELIKNHSMNFLMEEYLNYFSGTSFDEQKYSRFDIIKEIIDTEFSKFVTDLTGTPPQNLDNVSIESFFAGETFLSETENYKKFLITPKKFDRVFHIMFDPDDFDVDKQLTEPEIWKSKYDIENIGRMSPGTISFEKYYVAIESYDEKEPKV